MRDFSNIQHPIGERRIHDVADALPQSFGSLCFETCLPERDPTLGGQLVIRPLKIFDVRLDLLTILLADGGARGTLSRHRCLLRPELPQQAKTDQNGFGRGLRAFVEQQHIEWIGPPYGGPKAGRSAIIGRQRLSVPLDTSSQ
jgi:hypothetical protein